MRMTLESRVTNFKSMFDAATHQPGKSVRWRVEEPWRHGKSNGSGSSLTYPDLVLFTCLWELACGTERGAKNSACSHLGRSPCQSIKPCSDDTHAMTALSIELCASPQKPPAVHPSASVQAVYTNFFHRIPKHTATDLAYASGCKNIKRTLQNLSGASLYESARGSETNPNGRRRPRLGDATCQTKDSHKVLSMNY